MEYIDFPSLTFDDVMIVPQRSSVDSRKDVSTKSKLTQLHEINVPIISANMKTVTDSEMAEEMAKKQAAGAVHREMTPEDSANAMKDLGAYFPIVGTVGANGDVEKKRAQVLFTDTIDIIIIDIAHLHLQKGFDMIDFVLEQRGKHHRHNVDIMVGNIATPDAAFDLMREFGKNIGAVKVGIGPGYACKTRKVSGVGVGQISAISEVYDIVSAHGVPICADGGIRKPADLARAIAAGANTVMMGYELAQCAESPGWEETPEPFSRVSKVYKGSAHFDHEENQALASYKSSEGGVVTINKQKSLEEIIDYYMGGLRSAMSYSGAHTIEEFHKKAIFRRVTPNTAEKGDKK